LRQATGIKVVVHRAGHKKSDGECGRSIQEIERFKKRRRQAKRASKPLVMEQTQYEHSLISIMTDF
jgi:hypothetical protein